MWRDSALEAQPSPQPAGAQQPPASHFLFFGYFPVQGSAFSRSLKLERSLCEAFQRRWWIFDHCTSGAKFGVTAKGHLHRGHLAGVKQNEATKVLLNCSRGSCEGLSCISEAQEESGYHLFALPESGFALLRFFRPTAMQLATDTLRQDSGFSSLSLEHFPLALPQRPSSPLLKRCDGSWMSLAWPPLFKHHRRTREVFLCLLHWSTFRRKMQLPCQPHLHRPALSFGPECLSKQKTSKNNRFEWYMFASESCVRISP